MTDTTGISSEKMPLTSLDIAEEKRELLKKCLAAAFPEAVAEDQIDFDQLKRVLGECVEPDRERFGLNWPGKASCMTVIQAPSIGTLKPYPQESVAWDTTKNLFIEGDNLEVLKLLQKAYFNKVKMIYIDPPYNTGNEFIYPDKYAETLETYLEYSGQKDTEGRRFSTNTDTSGRFHSRWLSMMYPRLYLAKNLLRQDGRIFISIDDNEQANLKAVCDQIFGEENFVASIAWQKVFAKKNKALVSGSHDHILLYAKDIESCARILLPRTEDQLKAFKNPDNDSRGRWQSVAFSVQSEDSARRASYRYRIKIPSGREVLPPSGRHWNGLPPKYQELLDDNRIWFGSNGDSLPRVKVFLSEVQAGIVPDSWWRHEETGNNQEAKKEVLELFEGVEPYSTPKPTRLMRRMIQIATRPDVGDIVLDFFGGSSSTAHALMLQNAEDSGNRSFVLVQLPEPTGNSDFDTISEIGIERIRRASKKIRDDNPSFSGDFGVRFFKLSRSCFKLWDGGTEGLDDKDLIDRIAAHVDHVDPSATSQDILFELLMKDGFPLTVPIKRTEVARKEVFSIAEGALLICLDKELTQELMDALAEMEPGRIICLDAGFKGNDQLKANAVQTFKARTRNKETVIEFRTV